MANPPSPDDVSAAAPSLGSLRNELARRGLPRAYIERFLSELDDHFVDLLEERSSPMGAARKLQFDTSVTNDPQQRLGEPAQLAVFAAEQYHARSFWGRHPVVTFVLAPLPMLLACLIGLALALQLVGRALSVASERLFGLSENALASHEHLFLSAVVIAFVSWYIVVGAPLFTAWLLCRTYRRNAVDRRWPIIACTLLAVVVALSTVSYRLATEPNQSTFMVGLHAADSLRWFFLTFLPKFALALAIGLLLVKRAERQLELDGSNDAEPRDERFAR